MYWIEFFSSSEKKPFEASFYVSEGHAPLGNLVSPPSGKRPLKLASSRPVGGIRTHCPSSVPFPRRDLYLSDERELLCEKDPFFSLPQESTQFREPSLWLLLFSRRRHSFGWFVAHHPTAKPQPLRLELLWLGSGRVNAPP